MTPPTVADVVSPMAKIDVFPTDVPPMATIEGMPSQSLPHSVAPAEPVSEMELSTLEPAPQVYLDVVGSDVVVTISSSLLADA